MRETVEDRILKVAGDELAKAGVCHGWKNDVCKLHKARGQCAWCLSRWLIAESCRQLAKEEKAGKNKPYIGEYRGEL